MFGWSIPNAEKLEPMVISSGSTTRLTTNDPPLRHTGRHHHPRLNRSGYHGMEGEIMSKPKYARVPIKPTKKMIKAARGILLDLPAFDPKLAFLILAPDEIEHIWSLMLEARK